MAGTVIAVTALFVALGALALWWRQLGVNRQLLADLEELRRQPESARAEAPPAAESFASRLTRAEEEQEQKETSEPQVKALPQAERYRYAAALAQQGYTKEGISEALQLAPAEVEQIMHLSRLSRLSRSRGSGSHQGEQKIDNP